jgi:uncharacterized membrane protein YccF (DUF307 family)
MSLIGNLVWLVFGGFFAALGYIFGGFLLCLTLTIIGIPFARQHLKLVELSLMPFSRQVI